VSISVAVCDALWSPVVPVPVVKALKEAMDKGTCALGTPVLQPATPGTQNRIRRENGKQF